MAKLLDKPINGRFPFKWRSSAETDVSKTWAKARKEQQKPTAEVISPAEFLLKRAAK